MKAKNICLTLCILNFLILSCNSNKEISWNNKKIGNFIFSLPEGSYILYNSLDSVDGEIEFREKFTVNFSKGYFIPSVLLSEEQDGILEKDTIGSFITSVMSRIN